MVMDGWVVCCWFWEGKNGRGKRLVGFVWVYVFGWVKGRNWMSWTDLLDLKGRNLEVLQKR